MQKKFIYSLGSLALLLILFVAISMLSSSLLRGLRVDLTQNGLYTLSDGTRNILRELQEPVNLYLFFSGEASRGLPQIRSYARRVDEMVEEFENQAAGKLLVHRVDPEPFSEEEEQAAAFGLQAVPVGAGNETLYLGIAGTNSLDDVHVMPFLQPSKEKFLEYDLAKMISSLGSPEKMTIGFLSTLQMEASFDQATQGMREAWVVYEQLGQLFDIETIEPGADSLPDHIDLLLLVHPKDLSEPMMYQLDQFVLGGGRLIVFLDPFAESDRGNPNDPMAMMQAGSASNLGLLLDSWGVSFETGRVIGDLQYGVGTSQSRHIGILSVPADGLNSEDIVSADLQAVNFSSTGWLAPLEGAGTSFEVLVQSSENAAPLDTSRLRFLTNPAELMKGFNPTGDRYTLAARLTGPARSAFDPPDGDAQSASHRSESGESGITVMLFADTDLLTDRLWVQKQPFLGQNLVSAFADNGTLVVNAVDNMLGNRNLINIRTRVSSSRPFDRVSELQVVAERNYLATEERLQQELTETERKLTELQLAKSESELFVLSDEQQAEINRFMDRKLEIRKQLRQVQHNLQRDIDRLGTRLKLINIVLMPVLVMIAALLYALRRRRRQNTQQVSEGAV
ncbi:MAG: Gldg family protein [Xanthomonadales bacterium]